MTSSKSRPEPETWTEKLRVSEHPKTSIRKNGLKFLHRHVRQRKQIMEQWENKQQHSICCSWFDSFSFLIQNHVNQKREFELLLPTLQGLHRWGEYTVKPKIWQMERKQSPDICCMMTQDDKQPRTFALRAFLPPPLEPAGAQLAESSAAVQKQSHDADLLRLSSWHSDGVETQL